MSVRHLLARLRRPGNQLMMLSTMAAVCMAAAIVLSVQVFARLHEYGSARADNIQWTLAQLEVDHTKMLLAFDQLDTAPPARQATAVVHAEQRFDILFSRVSTLTSGSLYRAVLSGLEARGWLDRVSATLDQMAKIIDTGPEAILQQQAALLQLAHSMDPPIRRLSVMGVSIEARLADAERQSLTTVLSRLAVLSLVMMVALLALLGLIWRMNRSYRRRALDNRTTLRRLGAILDTSQDAILSVTPDGRIVDSNDTAQRLFDLGDAIGQPNAIAGLLVHPPAPDDPDAEARPLTGAALMALCADGPARNATLLAQGRDGRRFPAELSAGRAPRGPGTVCVCFVRDISRRRAHEEGVARARDAALSAERTKARFLGMVSHEMRTPLHGVLGALDLLEETELDLRQRRYAQVMKASGQVLLGQVEDALDITHAQGGQLTLNPGAFDLDALVTDLTEGQAPQADAQGDVLELELPDVPLGCVIGDRMRVSQILLNLVSNAIKFTRGGRITLSARRLPPGPGMPDDAGTVEFRVRDTGIGISGSDLPHVFEDFVRLDDPHGLGAAGTGLGLGIVRRLIELMEGEQGAESTPGKGSLFWVRLPLPPAPVADLVPADPLRATPLKMTDAAPAPLDILVVEDNAINRLVIETMLANDGHRVRLARDGAEGIVLAAAHRHDVIIMDLAMPGIDGAEATRRIRAGGGASAGAHVVALTAYLRPERDLDLRGAGFDQVQTKPLQREALRAVLSGARRNLSRPVAPDRAAGLPDRDDTPLMDCGHFDQLAADLTPSALQKLLEGLVSEGETLVSDLPALRAGPHEVLRGRLHSFAGSAAMAGLSALHATLDRAENAIAGGDEAALSEALRALPGLWGDSCRALDRRARAA